MTATFSAPYTKFGKTKLVPVVLSCNGYSIGGTTWEKDLWAERDEDYYALSAPGYKDKRVRIISRDAWLAAPEVEQDA